MAIMHTMDYSGQHPVLFQGMQHAPTCTAKRKKLRFHPVPLTQNLFDTVIKILLPQYAKMDSTGLLRFTVGVDILGEDGADLRASWKYSWGGARVWPNSAANSSFSFCSGFEDHEVCGEVALEEGRDRGDGLFHVRLGPSVLETPTKVVVVGEWMRESRRRGEWW